jgi:hypothetical protein
LCHETSGHAENLMFFVLSAATLILALLVYREPARSVPVQLFVCASLVAFAVYLSWAIFAYPNARMLRWDGAAGALQMAYRYIGLDVERHARRNEVSRLCWVIVNQDSECDVRYLRVELFDGASFDMPLCLRKAEALALAMGMPLVEESAHDPWVNLPAPAPFRNKARSALMVAAPVLNAKV